VLLCAVTTLNKPPTQNWPPPVSTLSRSRRNSISTAWVSRVAAMSGIATPPRPATLPGRIVNLNQTFGSIATSPQLSRRDGLARSDWRLAALEGAIIRASLFLQTSILFAFLSVHAAITANIRPW